MAKKKSSPTPLYAPSRSAKVQRRTTEILARLSNLEQRKLDSLSPSDVAQNGEKKL